MNILSIKIALDEIKDKAHDDEVAHMMEKELLLMFVEHVEKNADEDLAIMAHEVLKVNEIDFSRWFA